MGLKRKIKTRSSIFFVKKSEAKQQLFLGWVDMLYPLTFSSHKTLLISDQKCSNLKLKKNCLYFHKLNIVSSTVVVVYINIMKTTFDLNFDSDQAFKQHTHKQGNK